MMSLFDFYRTFSSGTQILLATFVACLGWHLSKNIKKWWGYSRRVPPGPVGLTFVGYVPFLGSEPHRILWKLKDKYGDVMSLYMGNKYTVILSEFNVARDVLSHTAALDRAPELFESLPCIGFQAENREPWVEQRRFCLSATRDLGLGRGPWEDLITDEVVNFIEEIRKTGGKSVDITETLALSISSNILSLLIGRKLNKKEEADKLRLSLEFAEVSFIYMGPSEPASVVPGLRKSLEFLRIQGYDRAARIIRNFGSFVKEEIARHKTSPEFRDVHDFINTYLQKLAKIGNIKHYFSEHMLQGNLSILFLGASDTVFSSLCWLMRLMADHKDIEAKVYAELMEVLGKDGIARYGERDKIPYTFAVLMEAQRLSSIVPISTTRRLSEDIVINGFTLLKGAEVAANLWGIHNDPKNWDKPHLFIPERFLTENGTKLVRNPPNYAPFSTGRRNCPGETIAWREILGYFTEIVKKFEICLPEGEKAKYEHNKWIGYTSKASVFMF